ncbi:serine hydrolase domain-containing protein [Pseudoalteromonas obscura]|uniref:Serine hydrolase domain-containing protein n=1 Tax=Pseudoalteromonas obscura TaxID=3048491 RepID=A0ABT7EGB2_9GAMM|nr:serine hydrolase domain-containing protein [Pseudoalteromonas sp. P94(2023)]MDK2593976.1 serine hydrolase domain-containing protein [Pseudoalteromonas sp. P94(2023)]
MKLIYSAVFLLLTGCNQHENADDEIDRAVAEFSSKNSYVGLAISAVKGERTIESRQYGFADKALGVPFDQSSLISLGSNAKTVIAAAILQLEERGLLETTDTIQQHFPFELKYFGQVTVGELLCHTSGIPDVFNEEQFQNYRWQKSVSQKEFVDKLNEKPIVIQSGTRYSYNNTGFFLLGMVIEHLSNQPIGDFLREEIFPQAKDPNLYYLGDSFYQPALVTAYEQGIFGNTVYQDPVEYRVVGGAGALGGNLTSYIKLFRAIFSGKVLTTASLNKMTTPCRYKNKDIVRNKQGQQVGLGIEITQLGGQLAFTRGGALNGYVSTIYHIPATNTTYGITGNTWSPLAPLLEEIILKHTAK